MIPIAAGVLAAVILYVSYRVLFRKPGRSRAMSFSSSCMLEGAFPPALRMPDPIINVCLFFDELPSKEESAKVVEALCYFELFHSVPVKVAGEWCWEPQAIDVEQHLSEVACDGEEAIWQRIEEVKAQPLGAGSPLFHITRLRNVGRGLHGVVVRIHHSIGDGISLVGAMQRVIRDANGEELKLELPGKSSRSSGGAKSKMDLSVASSLGALFKVLTVGVSAFDARLAFSPEVSGGAVTYSGSRVCVVFPDMELSFLKQLKDKVGVTLNDVLMAAFAGALRRYAAADGGAAPDASCQVRALLPVAFPRSAEETQDAERSLRNRWAFVSAPLPVGTAGIRERIASQAAAMKVLKTTPVAPIQDVVQNSLLKFLPTAVNRQIASDAFSRHSVVFSNVPGPQEPVRFAGQRLRKLHMVFPNLIMQVGILSYDGAVFMNACVDPEATKSPALLKAAMAKELVEMAAELGVPQPEPLLAFLRSSAEAAKL